MTHTSLPPLADMVRLMAENLVTRPEAVRLAEVPDGDMLVLELSAAPEDLGRLIGYRGRTVASMECLLAAAAERRGIRCSLEINET
jgi:predicted RNA-binding protein YlqC (UPF0109 family)